MDTSLNRSLRQEVAEDEGRLTLEFCRAARHPHAMRRLQEAFEWHLQSYVKSALLDKGRDAQQYREEVCRLITRAKEITQEKQGVIEVAVGRQE